MIVFHTRPDDGPWLCMRPTDLADLLTECDGAIHRVNVPSVVLAAVEEAEKNSTAIEPQLRHQVDAVKAALADMSPPLAPSASDDPVPCSPRRSRQQPTDPARQDVRSGSSFPARRLSS